MNPYTVKKGNMLDDLRKPTRGRGNKWETGAVAKSRKIADDFWGLFGIDDDDVDNGDLPRWDGHDQLKVWRGLR